MSKSTVRDVIANLAERDTAGFRASYVARETGQPVADVQKELVGMVDQGELTLHYQLLCPFSGAVLARYERNDVLPIGEELDFEDCEPFTVREKNLTVAYVPTKQLLTDLLKEAKAPKTVARRRGLRGWALAKKATGSIKQPPFGQGTTTT